MQQKKVVIIGAGPAGISAALNLKEKGIDDILVLEKSKFPRYKCCAGYITNKTKKEYEKLGLNIDKCHYSLIEDFNIFYKHHLKQTIKNKFLYTNSKIDRVELDNKFFLLAKKKKINILENVKIKNIDLEKKILSFDDKKIEFMYLIFADGTFGYGSKFQKHKKKNIAMQMTFPSKIKDSIEIHFGITKKGYAWISSYQGITNVGITDVYNSKTNYDSLFKNFLKENNIKVDTASLQGAFTPIGVRKPIINNSIFYIGDAVGACDPLTLSGLRYALKSGEKCAEAIALQKQRIYLKYIQSLKIKFLLMKILMNIFYLKVILFCIFNIGCKYFGKIIAYIFNHFFINKK